MALSAFSPAILFMNWGSYRLYGGFVVKKNIRAIFDLLIQRRFWILGVLFYGFFLWLLTTMLWSMNTPLAVVVLAALVGPPLVAKFIYDRPLGPMLEFLGRGVETGMVPRGEAPDANQKKSLKIMFDTNVFNKMADGLLDIEQLRRSTLYGFEYFTTHVQTDQIAATPDNESEKRKRMVLFQTEIKPTVLPTTSFVLGVSRLGYGNLSDGKLLDKIRRGNKSIRKTTDALIAETCIKNKITLVTEDTELIKRMKEEGGKVIGIQELKEFLNFTVR